MRFLLTDFARNAHFGPNARGTKIFDHEPQDFEDLVNEKLALALNTPADLNDPWVASGAADPGRNSLEDVTGALCGGIEITADNVDRLRSGYKARRDPELPVLARWFDASEVIVPRASWIDYDAEQMAQEGHPLPEGYTHGIVAILGLPTREEPPMPPATMIRNALGVAEGGSGGEVTLRSSPNDLVRTEATCEKGHTWDVPPIFAGG